MSSAFTAAPATVEGGFLCAPAKAKVITSRAQPSMPTLESFDSISPKLNKNIVTENLPAIRPLLHVYSSDPRVELDAAVKVVSPREVLGLGKLKSDQFPFEIKK